MKDNDFETTIQEYLEKYVTFGNGVALFYHGPLAQWWYSPFEISGISYNCCEQYMMATKAMIFNDTENYLSIMEQNGAFDNQKNWNRFPREMQRIGRLVRNYNAQVWEHLRQDVVFTANLAKFSQNPLLLELIKQTESFELAEASPIDYIWGIGLKRDDPDALLKEKWEGKNLLGKALTAVRNCLREGNSVADDPTSI